MGILDRVMPTYRVAGHKIEIRNCQTIEEAHAYFKYVMGRNFKWRHNAHPDLFRNGFLLEEWTGSFDCPYYLYMKPNQAY